MSIRLYKGSDSNFAGQEIVVNISTTLDLTGYSAEFTLWKNVQVFPDISSGQFVLLFPAAVTAKFPKMSGCGKLVLIDSEGLRFDVGGQIRFEVTSAADINDQEFDLSIVIEHQEVSISVSVVLQGVGGGGGGGGTDANAVPKSDEGFAVVAPTGGSVKTFNPDTATQGEMLDFLATLVATLKEKQVI